MCISVFALLRGKGGLLVGVSEPGGRWDSEWLPSNRKDADEPDREGVLWRLPSAYLIEGEHPEEALRRVVQDQLGIRAFEHSDPRVLSYSEPSDLYPGNRHWDLAFAYEVTASRAPRRRPHWKELLFLDASELRTRNFGWNDDFVRNVAKKADRPGPKGRSG
jgi:ADP-ribose pyrophosphatase YjhB (NUDIX family)